MVFNSSAAFVEKLNSVIFCMYYFLYMFFCKFINTCKYASYIFSFIFQPIFSMKTLYFEKKSTWSHRAITTSWKELWIQNFRDQTICPNISFELESWLEQCLIIVFCCETFQKEKKWSGAQMAPLVPYHFFTKFQKIHVKISEHGVESISRYWKRRDAIFVVNSKWMKWLFQYFATTWFEIFEKF